jgi:hypothetical protein
VHTVVLALVACAFTLPNVNRILPQLFQLAESRQNKGQYTALPLEELGEANGRLIEPTHTPLRHEGKVRITVLALAVCALVARIEIYRRVAQATECTIVSVEVFLPFLLAVWDCFASQRSLSLRQEEKPDSSVYEGLRSALRINYLGSRARYLLPAFLVSYGCYLTRGLWLSINSTYICPVASGEQKVIPTLQICSLILDFCLVVIAYETSPKPDGSGLSGRRCVVLWCWAMLGTSVVWCVIAVIFYAFKPEIRAWLLFLYPALEFSTLVAIAGHIFIFCILGVSLLHCVSRAMATSRPILISPDYDLRRLGYVYICYRVNDYDTRHRVHLVTQRSVPPGSFICHNTGLPAHILRSMGVSSNTTSFGQKGPHSTVATSPYLRHIVWSPCSSLAEERVRPLPPHRCFDVRRKNSP